MDLYKEYKDNFIYSYKMKHSIIILTIRAMKVMRNILLDKFVWLSNNAKIDFRSASLSPVSAFRLEDNCNFVVVAVVGGEGGLLLLVLVEGFVVDED